MAPATMIITSSRKSSNPRCDAHHNTARLSCLSIKRRSKTQPFLCDELKTDRHITSTTIWLSCNETRARRSNDQNSESDRRSRNRIAFCTELWPTGAPHLPRGLCSARGRLQVCSLHPSARNTPTRQYGSGCASSRSWRSRPLARSGLVGNGHELSNASDKDRLCCASRDHVDGAHFSECGTDEAEIWTAFSSLVSSPCCRQHSCMCIPVSRARASSPCAQRGHDHAPRLRHPRFARQHGTGRYQLQLLLRMPAVRRTPA